MHLTRKDVRATLAVAAAGIFYLLWSQDTIAGDMSVRMAAAIVFVLGWIGCTSDVDGMKAVFGVDGHRPPITYVVLASAVGAVAFVSGIVAIVRGSETMLATLVVSTVMLWLMTTVRHAFTRPVMIGDEQVATPLEKAA